MLLDSTVTTALGHARLIAGLMEAVNQLSIFYREYQHRSLSVAISVHPVHGRGCVD